MKNMRKRMQKLKNEGGLTLVELLAVIVILGIVATIAFVSIGSIIENSKKDAHIANAEQVIAAAKLYEISEGEIGSTGVKIKDLQAQGYMEEIIDPWTKEVLTLGDTSLIKREEEKSFVVTLEGKETISGATEADLRKGRSAVYGAGSDEDTD